MPATPKRPGTILGAAILLLIFGVYALLGGLCAGFIALNPSALENLANLLPRPPAGPNGKQQDPLEAQKRVAKEAPAYVPVMACTQAVGTLLGLLALIAGLGALKMKPSARRLGIFVALAVIVSTLIQTGYNFAYVVPITIQVAEEQAEDRPPGMPDMSGATKVMTYGFTAFAIVFQLVIWGIILMLLRSKSATDAFAGKFPEDPPTSAQEQPSRYEGYDDDAARPAPPPKLPGDTGITDRPS